MNKPDGLSKRQVLIFFGLLFCFIVFAVISSILGSKVHTEKNDLPPEAYGLDTFEQNAPAVLHVSVWQRNDRSKPGENGGRIITDEVEGKYYNKIEMETEPGFEVCTTYDPLLMPGNRSYASVLTVSYDGPIRVTYDPPIPSLLSYMTSDRYIPSLYGGEINASNDQVVTSTDGTVSGDSSFTLSIDLKPLNTILSKYDRYSENKLADSLISTMESQGNVQLRDYYRLEDFKEICPDGPKTFMGLQRIAYTTRLTVEGMHPGKSDVVLAKMELEITSYTWWLNTFEIPMQEFRDQGVSNYEYSVVKLLSYSQSERME